jgi:hypothetical protein
MGSTSEDSRRKLFTKLKLLPLPSLHIFSLLRFVAKNKEFFITHKETHNYDTRQSTDLHFPSVSLKKVQTGVHYVGVKIYNSLLNYIKTEINTIKNLNSF